MILIGWLSLSTEPFKPGRAQLSLREKFGGRAFSVLIESEPRL
jgi:hypothetical protein